MKTIHKFILILCLTTYSLFAGDYHALAETEPIKVPIDDSSFYIGAGVSSFVLDDDTTAEELSTNTSLVIVGYSYNPYIAIEGRYYKGLGDIDYSAGDTQSPDAVYDSDFSNIALFLKASYPVSDMQVYALLGYGQLELTNIAGSDRVEKSLQYGLGMSYKVSDNVELFTDWLRAYDDKGFDGRAKNDDISIDLVSMGVTYKF